jgi:hypothetical protein
MDKQIDKSCNKGVGHDFCTNKLGGTLSLVYITIPDRLRLQYLVSRNI